MADGRRSSDIHSCRLRIVETCVNDSASHTTTSFYIARQPILDERGRVFGYELLYRDAIDATACITDGDLASARVLTGALLDLGLDMLTSGRQAFLNVTRPLLGQVDTLIPPEGVVIELLESVAIDDDVIATCRDLRARGYQLALDDFVPGSAAEVLLPHVAYVKVDVLATAAHVLNDLPARLAPSGVTLLAEKVESRDVYQQAAGAGFRLFQGYYFCRPIVQSNAAVPAQQLTYLRLLAALSDPDLTTTEVERLVKQDVSLSLRVLRSVNSAAHPIRTEVRSIGQALFLLGIDPIRKWAAVWCLAGLNKGPTPELTTLALMRARTCELIGQRLLDGWGSELFLVGLFSLLDVMLGRTMAAALGALPLSDTASAALQGEPNTLRAVLDAVVNYERGQWNDEAAAAVPGLAGALPEAYTNALRWTQDVSRATA
jgi:EAL and modified HD-GYP domain-containing signal transduction protein